MRILIGEISSYKAIVIATYIKKHYSDVSIYSYDYSSFARYVHTKYIDKHFTIKFNTATKYIGNLAKLVSDEQIDCFFPVHSHYIGSILENKHLFSNSLAYLGHYAHYQMLHQKDVLQSMAADLGIDIPKNYRSIECASVPFVAKPTSGSSSKGVEYFLTDKKKTANKDYSNYVFQEYIEGRGCGYSVYAVNGKIKVGYGHMRLAEHPISGGSSVYRMTYYEGGMREIAERILNKVSWTGFAMFEFKKTSNGRLVLIEVNPRIWGSINQGLQNGFDFFEPILSSNAGGVIQKKTDVEINTYLSPQIYISLLSYFFKKQFFPINNFISNYNKNKADVSLWADPKGWISLILRKVL